ncbi:MAG: aspartate aminotransferase family protein [Bacillota bacterium]
MMAGLAPSDVTALADRYLMHTYRRDRLVLVRGSGCWVWDAEGGRYLDFVSGIGVNAVGHCHPRVVQALAQQAAELMHVSNLFYTEPQALLAKWLAEHTPFDRTFLCNSGAEAVEAAIKLARRYHYNRGEHRFEVVTATGSFHGRTFGALSATGQLRYHEGFEPLVPGFRYVPFNDARALRESVHRGTAAVLLEVVQGEGGVHPADPGFVRAAREAADSSGALLIIDEVQTGLGRTGRLFAFEHYGIVPDAVTLAKALGGGVAIGALLAREPAACAFAPGHHASTFGGNPLACRAALAALEAIEQEGLVRRAAEVGSYLAERLREAGRRAGHVVEVRGLGLMLAIEFDVPARAVAEACRKRGLLVNVVAEKALRLLPPLVIGRDEADRAASILEAAIRDAAAAGEA